ncbi:PKD domain-containing protein [uncultured Polaribacter sp.]|uniref:PKD domain-containing protein n=1 Tax=uncultured Polaribacter sp. TaxID=174711 RepID=UPI00260EB0A0|nr:PKD domain-containing protein [uncultured Polaribacter sp.]
MNLNTKLKNGIKYLPLVAMGLIFTSCQPEELGEGNGLIADNLNADFTITEVSEANNTYTLSANNSYITSSWDLGKGAGFSSGSSSAEVFFPDAGTYTVQHKVTGIGGVAAISSQTVNVATSDPVAGNIVKGGKFEDASAHNEWTVLNISGSGAGWTFNEGSATIVASGFNQQGIYQPIEVIANKTYTIDMIVSGDGNNDTWFEVFASTVEPVQWNDYGNNIVMGLNTWGGCGTGAFNGILSSVGCVDNSYSSSRSNEVTFDTSGTIYLVIKCGGGQTSGITISNVEMRGSN